MNTTHAGQTSQKNTRRRTSAAAPITVALVLAVSGLGLGGCDRPDAAGQAITKAQIDLDAISNSGATPIVLGNRERDTFQKIISELKDATSSGTPTQAAAANLLVARAQAGLATMKVAEVVSGQERFINDLGVAKSALDQWIAQHSVADSLSLYDPTKDLADLEKQATERLAEAQAKEADKVKQEGVVAQIRARATAVQAQAASERAKVTAMRAGGEGQSQTARLATMEQAREASRRADELDRQAAELVAQANKEAPVVTELQSEADRLKRQADLLRTAKADIQKRVQTSQAQAKAARDEAAAVGKTIEKLVNDLAAAKDALAGPTNDAVKGYEQAIKSAKQAGTSQKQASSASAGIFQQALGDVLAARLRGLASYSAVLNQAVQSRPALPFADALKAKLGSAVEEAKTTQDQAKAAYEGALSSLGAMGGSADVKERMEKVKTALKELSDFSPPANDPAQVEAQIRESLDKIHKDLQDGNVESTLAFLKFKNDQEKEAFTGLLNQQAKFSALDAACKEKFGKPLGELISASTSPAVKDSPVLKMLGPAMSQGGSGFDLSKGKLSVKDAKKAELVVASPLGEQKMTLAREGGAWRGEANLPPALVAMVGQMSGQFAPLLGAVDNVTAEIRKGTYANSDDMLAELGTKLTEAAGAMAKPGAPAGGAPAGGAPAGGAPKPKGG